MSEEAKRPKPGWPKGLTKPGWAVGKSRGMSLEEAGQHAAELNAEAAAEPKATLDLSGMVKKIEEKVSEIGAKREPLREIKEVKTPPRRLYEDPRHPFRDPDQYPEDEDLPMHIPESDWPDGYALCWVGWKVWNQPDPSIRALYERKGYVSVHHGDFDGKFDGRWLPLSHQGEIEVGGQILMARPKTWHLKAKLLQERRAREVMQLKAQHLTQGGMQLPWGDPGHSTALQTNKIASEWERVRVQRRED